eukprot:355821-Chlamydomonas_euryale.AAC.2
MVCNTVLTLPCRQDAAGRAAQPSSHAAVDGAPPASQPCTGGLCFLSVRAECTRCTSFPYTHGKWWMQALLEHASLTSLAGKRVAEDAAEEHAKGAKAPPMPRVPRPLPCQGCQGHSHAKGAKVTPMPRVPRPLPASVDAPRAPLASQRPRLVGKDALEVTRRSQEGAVVRCVPAKYRAMSKLSLSAFAPIPPVVIVVVVVVVVAAAAVVVVVRIVGVSCLQKGMQNGKASAHARGRDLVAAAN